MRHHGASAIALFAPEQSPRHFVSHPLFAASHLPILSIALPSPELQKILKPANVSA